MHLRSTVVLALVMLLFAACEKDLLQPENLATERSRIVNQVAKQVDMAQQEEQKHIFLTKRIPADAVELPAGSVDGLAAAIAEAGEGGTVLVKAGEHLENGTVTISHRVNIIGEEGAVILSGTQHVYTVGYVQPALHVLGANNVLIYGLDLQANADLGGTAILIQDAPHTVITRNSITNFGFGIVNQHGDRSYISYNKIVGSSVWLSDFSVEVHGIVNVNGDRTRIFNNEISNAIFGIWACDEDGMASGNTTNGNFIGLILCKVPTAIPLPDGSIAGSENAATDWIAHHNTANGNYHVGIIVIDGANNNLLVMNEAASNVDDNIELAGDTERFGFLTPTSFGNKVVSAPGVSIKDCGVDNSIIGGDQVDTSLHPCL